MLNRILFWILTRLYRVNPDFCNPVNWRVAHPAESISTVFGYSPLIFKGFMGGLQYGFENCVIFAKGRIYLVPKRVDAYYPTKPPIEPSQPYDYVAFSLVKYYIEIAPNILLKRFPTKLLEKLLRRQIPIQQKIIKYARNSITIDPNMTVEEAIKADLSKSSVISDPELKNYIVPKFPDEWKQR